MSRHCSFFVVVTGLMLVSASGWADSYPRELAAIGVANAVQTSTTEAGLADTPDVRTHVRATIERLFVDWRGTAWGLGAPQTDSPGRGKIDCGTFVGTVLVHAGFVVNHKKLQRQPSELIIKSVADAADVMRFRNQTMEQFIAGVRTMGEGLYIIGLDYHVGFLAVEQSGAVRFIHAGVYPGKVVDESAEGAQEIIESRYRVVGKILSDRLLRKWLARDRIEVRGGW